MNDKLLGMIGLAAKAGKVAAGGDRCSKAVRGGRAKLVIIASDASQNTKKDIINSCAYYNVAYYEYSDREMLGKYTGSHSCSAFAVTDCNFADALLDRLGKSLRETKKG